MPYTVKLHGRQAQVTTVAAATREASDRHSSEAALQLVVSNQQLGGHGTLETVGVLALFSKKPITDGVFQALGKAAIEIAVVIEQAAAR